MRSPTLVIAVVLGLCGFAWLSLRAVPNHIEIPVTTPPGDVRVTVAGGVASFEASKDAGGALSIATTPGAPAVPVRIVNVLLPPGHEAQDVEASAEDPVILANGVSVRRAGFPAPDPDGERPAAGPASMTAGDDATGFVRYLGTGTWHGYRIASYEVHPVQVEGDRVVLYRDVRLDVATSARAGTESAVRAGRATERHAVAIHDAVAGVVAN